MERQEVLCKRKAEGLIWRDKKFYVREKQKVLYDGGSLM